MIIDEESYIDDVNGGFLDHEMVREACVEEFAGWSTQIKETNGLQKFGRRS